MGRQFFYFEFRPSIWLGLGWEPNWKELGVYLPFMLFSFDFGYLMEKRNGDS